jgi:hypothetical protein
MAICSLRFLDSLLLLIWYTILTATSIATFVTVFPSPGEWLRALVSPEHLVIVGAVGFLAISTIRLAHNYGLPFYTGPTCYAFSVIAFKVGVANAWLRDPGSGGGENNNHIWFALMVPTFLLVVAAIVARYMWTRVATKIHVVWTELKPRRLRMMDRRLAKIMATTNNTGCNK